jgi:hypothetical protein
MHIIHFVLIRTSELKKARILALQELAKRKHAVTVADKRIPPGRASSYAHGTAGFQQGLQHVRMLQAASLLSVYTMLANIYGGGKAREFEEKYLHNPDAFKKDFREAFGFMGECAADVLLDRRCPKAVPGEDWERGDFDQDGFVHGLEVMCKLKKLLSGDYFTESYFLNTVTESALIPDDDALALMEKTAKEEGEVIAIVPIMLEMREND